MKAIETAFREVADALVASQQLYRSKSRRKRFWSLPSSGAMTWPTLRYRQGEDTYLNVLSPNRTFISAQQGLLQAQIRKLTSQISLYKALGGGWN